MATADGEIVLGLQIAETTQLIQAQLNQLSKNLTLLVTGKLDYAKTSSQLQKDLKKLKQNIDLVGNIDKNKLKKEMQSAAQQIKLSPQFDAENLKKQIEKANIKLDADVEGAESLKQVGNGLDTINKKSAATVISVNLLHQAFNALERAAKQMVSTAADLDKQLTDLRIVTGQNYEEASRLVDNYNQLAKELGATTDQVLSASSEWLRQGYNVAETQELIASSMVLSKVGAMDSAEATKNLTSAMKGYGLSVGDVAGIVDKLTAIDLEAALSASDLATAMSRTANGANIAGISMDRLLGYIAVVAETTQKSAETVGNSFQSMIARINNIKIGKFIDDETGEALNDTEKILNSFGIALRDTEGEFRTVSDVLDDVYGKWNSLTTVEKSAIATAAAGTRQRENFLVLMENYGKALEYAETATNSAGTAMEKFSAYQESMEAHYNSLIASAEALAKSTVPTELLTGLMDAASAVLDFLEATNLLTIALTALGTALTVKGLSAFGGKMKTVYQSVANLSTVFSILSKTAKGMKLPDDEFNSLLQVTKGLTASQLKLVVSNKALTTEQRMQILTASGLTKEQAAQTLTTMGLATAEGAATAATFSLSGAFKALGVAIAANPIGFILTALTTAISVISTVNSKLKEQRQETIAAGNEAAESAQNISNLVNTYLELCDAVDAGTASREDMIAAQNDVINALGMEGKSVDELIEKYGSLKNAIIQASLEQMETDISRAKSGADTAKKDVIGDLETWLGTSPFATNQDSEKAIVQWLYDQGLTTSNSTLMLPNSDMWDAFSNPSFEELAENRKYLEDAMNAVRKEFGSDNDTFKWLSEAYENYADTLDPAIEAIDNANKTIANYYIAAEKAISDPHTQEEFENFRQSIIDKVNHDFDWDDSGTFSVEGMVDTILASDSQYGMLMDALLERERLATEANSKIKEITDKFASDAVDNTQYTTTAEYVQKLQKITEQVKALEDNLKGLTDDELAIAYDAFLNEGATTWDEISAAIERYNSEQAVAARQTNQLKTTLRELWDSEGFADTKKSIEEMALSLNGITADNIDDIVGKSAELAAILDEDGMSAEFLAHILQTEITGGGGFELITEEALTLNKALAGLGGRFDEVTEAKSRYDVAMSVKEKDTDFKSYVEAFKELNEQFVAGTTNSNAFWAAAEFLFGSEQLQAWGWSDGLDEIYAAMQKNVGIFEEADSAGAGFLDRLYAISEAGEVKAADGTVIAQIEKLSDGSYDFNIDASNLDAVAEKLGITSEAALACMEALSMYGDVNLYDVETVLAAIEEIGLSSDSLDGTAVNVGMLTDQLISLGKTDKEIYDLLNVLQSVDGVTLLDANANVDSLTESLTNLGLAAQDDLTVTVNAEGLADLMSQLNFTKEDTQNVITKLGEADSITLTNAQGEVIDLNSALEHTNELEFASVTSELDGITNSADAAQTAVDQLQQSIRNLRGRTVTVTVDVQRKNTLLGGIFGYAKGTKDAPEGDALVGEEGEELVQSGDRAYLVGTNGPEITHLNEGDIVYTAEQTKRIKRGSQIVRGIVPAYAGGRINTNKKYPSVYTNTSTGTTTTTSTVKAVADASKSLEEALEDTLKAMSDTLDDVLGNFEHEIFLMEKHGADSTQIVAVYKAMQDAVHDQAEQYRKLGLDENSDYIQDLQKQWWEYQDEIQKLIVDTYDDTVDELKNAVTLTENWLDQAIANNDRGAITQHTSDIVDYYRQMQQTIHDQAEYYRSLGYSDTSNEVSKLSDLWWDYYDKIKSVSADAWQQVVDNANDALNEITGLYDTLHDAAETYAESGFITVKNLQDICSWGVQYLAYLQDENGNLVINEENIQKVIAARTQQMAIETALNYVQQLRGALTNNDTVALMNLTTATQAAATSTWDLVYAQLQLLGLDSQQYNNAVQRVNTLRSLTDIAVSGIGRTEGAIREANEAAKKALEEQSDALDDLLKYVEEMIKQEVQNQVKALEDQVDAYREIVDLQKKSLDLEKEKDDYTRNVAEKEKAIADLRQKIATLDMDDSREAAAEKAKLQEELSDLIVDLSDYQSDHAYDAASDMLDNMADAYEKEKQKEIDVLENSISSEEKLYRLAIDRINNHWDTLYQDLINWNYEYGTVTNDEITRAWDAASTAVQQYGSYLNAVLETQRQIASLEASSSSYSYSGGTTGTGGNTTLGKTGEYDTSGGAVMAQIKSIVAQMKANSAQHHSEDAAGKLRLNKANLKLGEELAGKIGRVVVRGDDGVWYLDKVGGLKLYDTYPYSTYHTGGVAGDEPTLDQKELMARLEKGELIVPEKQQESMFEVLDFADSMMGKYGKLFAAMGNTDLMTPMVQEQIKQDGQQTQSVVERGGDTINVTAPVEVYPLQKLDTAEIQRLTKDISKHTVSKINEVFTKNGMDSVLNPLRPH